MNSFLKQNIFRPFAANWLRGLVMLLFWTISFIAMPALSGWFLAACSVAFVTSNVLFAYLIPSSIIRLFTLVRTALRYFERLENHKTTLDGQRRLQLAIFQSVARLPYFKKQVNNNSTILENSTHGIDLILNHILLWLLPFTTLLISLSIYFNFANLLKMMESLRSEFPDLQIILGGQAFIHVSDKSLIRLGNVIVLPDLYLLEKFIETININP